ncbi:uncharacterized protein RCC_11289 [Ramularia collo-cygni]|uniref:RNA 3'-terminal phosphate cyclase domain-containing protein n=1 Tax=Ramularia collo-cygni TaxID=112498 RepID=A0A2D3V809_9PEZI|nr:uncharacterized protein RCC_11289 [Ramularia collo-cygni]CZT25621.1 uncharacterized protein RCC_11289 [Ramularia collo-cygni]
MAKNKTKVATQEPLVLDGRHLEGGGQLIRIAICLSALTSKPIQIENVRGNRAGGGGLKAQHLACVNWLAKASNANISGAEKGSKTLLFSPGKLEGVVSPAFTECASKDGSHIYQTSLDIGTAGSTGLALQAVLPFILFSNLPSHVPIHLRISGGTNVSGSPSFEYIKHVLLPTLHRIGFPDIKASLGKRGWSQGGSSIGNFTLEIPPRRTRTLSSFKYRPDHTMSYNPCQPSHLRAVIIAPTTCHDHFRSTLLPAIQQNFSTDFTATSSNLSITCEGSLHAKRFYFILVATVSSNGASSTLQEYTLARDWLYDKKISSLDRTASEMVKRVTAELADEGRSGTFVDEHMRDQLVIFQALASGKSEVYPGRNMEVADGPLREPSLHARTAEWVAKMVLGVKFDSEGSCEGVGFGEGQDVATLAKGLDQLQL